MNFKRKDPIIFLITGKAESGKSTVGKIIEEEYLKQEKKVVISEYTKYLKLLIENITRTTLTTTNKPRDLLQKLSSELIKKELNNKDFFINRQLEDLEIYSYFMDVIIIPDVRFENEINVVKNNYKNVYTIKVIRENYKSNLTSEQLRDITETSLDNYTNYDYKIINNDQINLKEKVLEMLNDLKIS